VVSEREVDIEGEERKTHQIDILAGYVYFLAAVWAAPSSSTVQFAAKLCGYHLSLTMS
jgi:hypothetical protein